jgi:DNA-binding MarR family transcriptional regulator
MNIPSYKSSILLTKAYRVLRLRVYASLQEYELNPTQWSLIGIVNDSKDGIRLSEVASVLGVKAPLITTIVHTLSKRGILNRIPNQIDARAKLLVITPKGKTLVKEIENSLTTTLSSLLGNLTKEEMLVFQKVLETIIKNENTK